MKYDGFKIAEKVIGAIVGFGVMDIFGTEIDRITADGRTNSFSKGVMRIGGLFLGGYLGDKAASFAIDKFRKGLSVAQKYQKMDISEDEEK